MKPLKVMLKTKCGCKQMLPHEQVVVPCIGSYYTRALVPNWSLVEKPDDFIQYRKFVFKEINKKGVAVYEEI